MLTAVGQGDGSLSTLAQGKILFDNRLGTSGYSTCPPFFVLQLLNINFLLSLFTLSKYCGKL